MRTVFCSGRTKVGVRLPQMFSGLVSIVIMLQKFLAIFSLATVSWLEGAVDTRFKQRTEEHPRTDNKVSSFLPHQCFHRISRPELAFLHYKNFVAASFMRGCVVH